MELVVQQPPPLSVLSNGHANGSIDADALPTSDMPEDDGHVSPHSNGVYHHDDGFDEANNQGTPTGHSKGVELPSIFSSFKNKIFGPTLAESPPPIEAAHLAAPYTPDVTIDLANGHEHLEDHLEDQHTDPEVAPDTATNCHKDQLCATNHVRPVNEASSESSAFPPCFSSQSPAHDAQVSLPARVAADGPPQIVITNGSTPSSFNHMATPSLPSTPHPHSQGGQITTTQKNIFKGPETNPSNQSLPPVMAQPDAVSTTTRSIFQTITGEYQEHTVLNSLQQSQINISAPPQGVATGGHHDQGEVAPYQQLTSQQHVTEHENLYGSKDGCQLPEYVMSRVNNLSTGSGIAAAGGAQMEHLLARVKQEKTASRARAWEESAKSKAFNRYTRDESKITAWENTMKAKAEARMRKAEEDLDKQRAKHIERMKNAVATAHRTAQERRAAMEARKAEEIVKAEEIASRIRATGKMPRTCLCLHA